MIAKRTIVAVLAVLSLAAGSSLAQGRGGGGGGGGGNHGGAGHPGGGGYHGGYYHGGHYPYYPYWGGVGIGIGIGLASGYYWGWPYYGYYYGAPYYYDYPVATYPGYAVTTAPPPPAPASNAPEPIYYPRNGQTDAQKETDLRDCNRWATTQPPAMADASVFQRAVLACMDGRGYTGR